MANKSMNFKAKVQMDASQFKKEALGVAGVVKKLQNSFLGLASSLGAGLGLGALLSNMRKTSVELSTAVATLENVSKVTKELTVEGMQVNRQFSIFGEDMKFVDGLAKEYRQDLISLTNGYAQFRAAATQCGVTLEDQKSIYESLTRAATFYHMSSDRTRDMMYAVTQMFSKGKVVAEELRRQLGNSLPGAFGIMALAAKDAGISVTGTVSELEDLMKKGKLLAGDVLPAFGKRLDEVTEKINLDSLQLTINELRNAWINLTKSVNMEGFYKKVLKGTTDVVNYISTHLTQMKANIMGILTGVVAYNFWGKLQAQGDLWLKNQKKNLRIYEAEFRKLDKVITDYYKSGFVSPSKKGPLEFDILKTDPNAIYKTKGGSLTTISQINTELERYKQLALEAGKANATINKQVGAWGVALRGVKNILTSIGQTIMSMGIAAIASAIIGALTSLWRVHAEFKKEIKELNKEIKDFGDGTKEAENSIAHTKKLAEQQLKVIEDTNSTEQQRKAAVRELNRLQGSIKGHTIDIKDNTETIRKKTREWLEDLKKVARAEAIINKQVSNETKIRDLQSEKTSHEAHIQSLIDRNIAYYDSKKGRAYSTYPFTGIDDDYRQIKELNKQIAILEANNKQLEADLDAIGAEVNEINSSTTTNPVYGDGGDTEKLKGLAKVFEDYENEVYALNAQLDAGAISAEEYGNEMQKLVDKTYKEVIGTRDLEEEIKKVENGHQKLADLTNTFWGSAHQMWSGLTEDIKRANKELDKYLEKNDSALSEYLKNVDTPQLGTRDASYDYKKTDAEILSEQRDIIKKFLDDIQAQIEVTEKGIAGGVTGLDGRLEALKKRLMEVISALNTLDDKQFAATTAADIDELQKKLSKANFSTFKDIATTFDRVGDGIEKIIKAFDEDWEENSKMKEFIDGWRKFASVLNEIIQLVDLFNGLMQTFNTINEISLALEKAQTAEIAKNTAVSLTNAGAKTAEASANMQDAGASAVSGAAKLPFPASLVAIGVALAAIAGVVATLKAMGKFENGGVVGGHSYHGDKQLIRANSKEMVLTTGQQRNLLNLANGGGAAGGEITFKLRGQDIVGAISNFNMKKRG